MTHEPRDSSELLRSAWRTAQPEAAPGGELEREDALTREAVGLLRTAWSAVEAPALPRRASTPLPYLSLTAAAALLLVSALALRALAPPTALGTSERLAGAVRPVVPRDLLADRLLAPRASVEPGPDRTLVLRSGKVRLILPAGGASPFTNPLEPDLPEDDSR